MFQASAAEDGPGEKELNCDEDGAGDPQSPGELPVVSKGGGVQGNGEPDGLKREKKKSRGCEKKEKYAEEQALSYRFLLGSKMIAGSAG